MNGKFWIAAGALLAGLGVAAGAVGTHLLKEQWQASAKVLETYDVAVRYQLYHAMALVVIGLVIARAPSRWFTTAAVLLLAGIVLFSGGIYGWLATDVQPLVHVVPIGGMCWIAGWLVLAVGALVARTGAN